MISHVKKIIIVGPTAAGKTTYAKKLATKFNLPLHHVDSVMFKDDWEKVSDKKFVNEIIKITDNDEWILEGYIPPRLFKELLEKVDYVIHIRPTNLKLAQNYLLRWFKHRRTPRPETNAPETLSIKKMFQLLFHSPDEEDLANMIGTPLISSKLITLNSFIERNFLVYTTKKIRRLTKCEPGDVKS